MQFSFSGTQIRINMPDWPSLSAEIARRFEAGQGFALATINLDHLAKLSGDQMFVQAYKAQDLVVADGRPVVWLSQLAKHPVNLLAGSDMVIPLAQLAERCGVPVAMIGSHEAALRDAAAVLKAEAPCLQIALHHAPVHGFDPDGAEAQALLAQLAQRGPLLCFLALGAGKQERFAARGRRLAPQVGFASVGAGLDFLGGHQRRAPRWLRRIAMEWLWRVLRDPARMIPRYLRCFAILPGQIRAALRLRG